MSEPARILIITGLVLIAAGLIVGLAGKLPPWVSSLGRLPGDLVVRRKNLVVYIPLVTSLLLSVFLSIILKLWSRK